MGCCKKLLYVVAVGLPVFAAVIANQAWDMWPELCCESIEILPEGPDAISPCDPVGKDIGKDMMEKGYTIIPNVISETDRKLLMEYANTLTFTNYFGGYRVPRQEKIKELAPKLWPDIEKIIAKLQKVSNLRVAAEDGSTNNSFSSTELLTANPDDPAKSVAHVWHQDFEAYYMSQHTDQYLNMYLVLEKPNPYEGGLTIAPFDTMKQRAKRLYDLMWGTSATSWTPTPEGGMTVRHHETYDKFYHQTFDLDAISCSPKLEAGDLLVLRGDTVHRTQVPVKGHRTTLSMRFSQKAFSVDKMLEGGMVKYARAWYGKEMFIIRAIESEFAGEKYDAWVNAGYLPSAATEDMVSRWSELERKIWFGHKYRVGLSVVRYFLGKAKGETFWPILYY